MEMVSTSKDEQIIYYYICKEFPDAINRKKIKCTNGTIAEADIFIPCINVAIEYDGVYWHTDKLENDIKKTKALNDEGIYVIHVRESGLQSLPDFDGLELWHALSRRENGMHTNEYITAILRDVSKFCEGEQKNKLENYNLTYDEYKKNLPDVNSIFFDAPVNDPVSNIWEINDYWDYEKNGRLKPENLSVKENVKVYLKCPSGRTQYVNSSMLSHSSERKETKPDTTCARICPLRDMYNCFFEGCNECSYYNDAIVKLVEEYLLNGVDLGDLNDESNLRELHESIASNEKAIKLAIKYLLKTDDEQIDARFQKLFTYSIGRSNGLLALGRRIKCRDHETLACFAHLQKRIPDLHVEFDISPYDMDDEGRDYLIKYEKWLISNKEDVQRMSFFSDLLGVIQSLCKPPKWCMIYSTPFGGFYYGKKKRRFTTESST